MTEKSTSTVDKESAKRMIVSMARKVYQSFDFVKVKETLRFAMISRVEVIISSTTNVYNGPVEHSIYYLMIVTV